MSERNERALDHIFLAYEKARSKHAPMKSLHEGYAIMLEEFDELWAEIKRYPNHDKTALRKEALHVAAMAYAFLVEVSDA